MKFITVILLAVLSTAAFSQDYKFELGAQGGANLTAMRFKNEVAKDQTKNKIAALGGLFFQYNITNTFSLRIDPTFERLNLKYKDRFYTDQYGNVGTIKSHMNFDYISIPVLFKASVGNKIRGFVHAGPSFNFLLQSKHTYDMSDRDGFKSIRTDDYKTFNFGIVTGLGVAIPLKESLDLSFEVRNNLGLTNINKDSNPDQAVQTNSTSLLVGIAYKFGSNQ